MNIQIKTKKIFTFFMNMCFSLKHLFWTPNIPKTSAFCTSRHFGSIQQVPSTFQKHAVLRSDNLSGSPSPIFKFGILSDVQYADIEDGAGFSGRPRYYRRSLEIVKEAASFWKEQGDIDFVLNLGDILDINCPPSDATAALERVIDGFCIYPGKVHHLIGNHCLYNHPREVLNSKLGIHSEDLDCSYYYFEHKDFVFVCLDGYDISATGRKEGDHKYDAAMAILTAINPNENLNSPNGLVGTDRRFVKFGGGVGQKQLDWLRNVLVEARKSGKRVVVCCHQPLEPLGNNNVCLLWNYDEILQLLQMYSDVVVATFSGHAHIGSHSIDPLGVHHRVIEAVIECPMESTAFGFVEVYSDKLFLCGKGALASTEMLFDFWSYQESESFAITNTQTDID